MNPRPHRADRRPAVRRPAVTRIGCVAIVLLSLGTAPAAADEAGGTATSAQASNTSSTLQVIWQVQQGCRSHCTATSQSQTAVQVAVTTQNATATAGATAVATNTSTTVQIVWQVQLGCVAYCFSTSQTQTADQTAQTTQLAVAVAAALAVAANSSSTVQVASQLQVGCAVECHDVTATQTSAGGQVTAQTARANVRDALRALLAELRAVAAQTSSTIQFQVQFEQAACLQDCSGETQVQTAVQSATTVQSAVVRPGPSTPQGARISPPRHRRSRATLGGARTHGAWP